MNISNLTSFGFSITRCLFLENIVRTSNAINDNRERISDRSTRILYFDAGSMAPVATKFEGSNAVQMPIPNPANGRNEYPIIL